MTPSSATYRKVILIGLDGTTFNVISPWILDGSLPTFKRIISQGTRGVLKSTIPCLTCPAIPTFYTSKNPGATKLFNFINSESEKVITSRDISLKFLWEILGQQGLTSLICNLKITYPALGFNGMMICDVRCAEKNDHRHVYPRELHKELEEFNIGAGMDSFLALEKPLNEGKKWAADKLFSLDKNMYDAFKHLLLKHDFDFSLFYVNHTDSIQHWAWQHQDLIKRFYENVDGILADVLRIFPSHNVMIFSDHGFSGYNIGKFHVNSWLHEKGYLKFIGPPVLDKLIKHALSLGCKIIPRRLIKKMLKNEKGNSKGMSTLKSYTKHIPLMDKKRSVAYLAEAWGIKIIKENLKDSYKDVCKKMILELQDLRDNKGAKVMKEVLMKSDLFSGPYTKDIPDIIIRPENYFTDYLINQRVFSEANDELSRWPTHLFAREGIFLAFGSDIKIDFIVENMELLDLAPTILHMLNCEIPKEYDGIVKKEIFNEGSPISKNDLKYNNIDLHVDRDPTSISQEENRLIEEHLKALGYLSQ